MGLFDRSETSPEGTSVERELKRSRFVGWRDVVICLLIVGFFLLTKNTFGLGAGITPMLGETDFGVVDLDGNTHTFAYAEAESIELRNDLKNFDRGERISGQETNRICSGTYRNEEFGEYELHVQKKLNNYIVVHAPDGVLVFNVESNDTTKSLYEYFIEQRNAQR